MEFTQRINISRNILMSIKKLKLNFIRNIITHLNHLLALLQWNKLSWKN